MGLVRPIWSLGIEAGFDRDGYRRAFEQVFKERHSRIRALRRSLEAGVRPAFPLWSAKKRK